MFRIGNGLCPSGVFRITARVVGFCFVCCRRCCTDRRRSEVIPAWYTSGPRGYTINQHQDFSLKMRRRNHKRVYKTTRMAKKITSSCFLFALWRHIISHTWWMALERFKLYLQREDVHLNDPSRKYPALVYCRFVTAISFSWSKTHDVCITTASCPMRGMAPLCHCIIAFTRPSLAYKPSTSDHPFYPHVVICRVVQGKKRQQTLWNVVALSYCVILPGVKFSFCSHVFPSWSHLWTLGYP